MEDEQPTTSASRPRKRRILRVAAILIVVLVYAGSLVSYYLLSGSERSLAPPDLGYSGDTIVQLTLESISTVDNRVKVRALVIPEDNLMDQRLGVLTEDIAVRFYPPNTLGDLQFPKGKAPAEVETNLVARGDVDRWPFDSYSTDALGADLILGSGDQRQFLNARVEATGALNGWNISANHSGPNTQVSGKGDFATIKLSRALGPLVFDVGICLVLVTLPVLALWVAIEMYTGRAPFLPPFGTWYAAMLFAVVPLRNVLSGAPPMGAWVDQIVVLWVLIGLATAMVIYILTWHKQARHPPKNSENVESSAESK